MRSTPNADLKLSILEHEASVLNWRSRKHLVQKQSGLLELKDLTVELKEEIDSLLTEFRRIRPMTFEGIAAKARVARALFRHEECWSSDISGRLVNYEIGILSGDLEDEPAE